MRSAMHEDSAATCVCAYVCTCDCHTELGPPKIDPPVTMVRIQENLYSKSLYRSLILSTQLDHHCWCMQLTLCLCFCVNKTLSSSSSSSFSSLSSSSSPSPTLYSLLARESTSSSLYRKKKWIVRI